MLVTSLQSLQSDELRGSVAVAGPLRPQVLLEYRGGRAAREVLICVMLHPGPVDALSLENLIAKLHGLVAEAGMLERVRLFELFLQLMMAPFDDVLRLDQAIYLVLDVSLECTVKYVLLLL